MPWSGYEVLRRTSAAETALPFMLAVGPPKAAGAPADGAPLVPNPAVLCPAPFPIDAFEFPVVSAGSPKALIAGDAAPFIGAAETLPGSAIDCRLPAIG